MTTLFERLRSLVPITRQIAHDETEARLKDVDTAIDALSGGAWDEQTISHLTGAWTPSLFGGTWTFVAGVISQTDATADSSLRYTTLLPSLAFVLEADVRVPTGQDAGTVAKAVIAAGCDNTFDWGGTGDLLGGGAIVTATGTGDDGSFTGKAYADGAGKGNGSDLVMAQDAWHTLRAVLCPTMRLVYLDGACVAAIAYHSVNNDMYAFALAAQGLVQFRNVKLWTMALPA